MFLLLVESKAKLCTKAGSRVTSEVTDDFKEVKFFVRDEATSLIEEALFMLKSKEVRIIFPSSELRLDIITASTNDCCLSSFYSMYSLKF